MGIQVRIRRCQTESKWFVDWRWEVDGNDPANVDVSGLIEELGADRSGFADATIEYSMLNIFVAECNKRGFGVIIDP